MQTEPFGGTKLRSLHIRDFRGIEELSLSFVGPDGRAASLVVLGGPNGSGKTSVLEAVLLVAGQSGLVRGPKDQRAVRAGCVDFLIEAEFETGGEIWTTRGSAQGREPAPTVSCDYFSSWRAPKLVGALGITSGEKKKAKRSPGAENRLSSIKQYLIDAKAFQAMGGPVHAGATSITSYDHIMSRIRDAWALFYPGAREWFSVAPAGAGPERGFDVFLHSNERPPIPMDALSAGQLEVFALLGAMAIAKDQPSLLCIDEPELHLDVQWHRTILRALRQVWPSPQFIIATHSTEVFESAMSFERHFLVPENDPRAKLWRRAERQSA